MAANKKTKKIKDDDLNLEIHEEEIEESPDINVEDFENLNLDEENDFYNGMYHDWN